MVGTVLNTGNQPVAFSPVFSGDASFSLATGSCSAAIAPGASCTLSVVYAPTTASSPATQAATLNLGIANLTPALPESVALTGVSGAVTGTVAPTANPLVALYTITSSFASTATVSFGPDTTYGRTTNTVTIPAGGSSSVFVAGMTSQSTYHMQASAAMASGSVGTDADQTFATGALPPTIPATSPVTLGTGTPLPGLELLNPVQGPVQSTLYATDLQGNTIWTYPFLDRTAGTFLYPGKQLPNGHFLLYLCPLSYPVGMPGSNILREIDLAGDTIHDLDMATLNASLAAAGFNVTLSNFSHDFQLLPNGHILLLTNTFKNFTNLPGYPGVTKVVGDVVVDLDPTYKPVWVWNSFDHLDVNRHPYMFPDWTHGNSLAYSETDGNIMVSLRHQNWILKIDYDNGAGAGDVIWHLGEGGDFTLTNGVDPTDWFYAQHDATFPTNVTAGAFPITIMDNGDDRIFPAGVTCGAAGAPPCLYTTIQELQLDETAKTAMFLFHQILPPSVYSFFAGNTELLPNGNFEYLLAGSVGGSQLYEVTPGTSLTATPTTVYKLTTTNSSSYRGFNMPSLYPGVTWTK
jgi:arylsulfate sulfotransferase